MTNSTTQTAPPTATTPKKSPPLESSIPLNSTFATPSKDTRDNYESSELSDLGDDDSEAETDKMDFLDDDANAGSADKVSDLRRISHLTELARLEGVDDDDSDDSDDSGNPQLPSVLRVDPEPPAEIDTTIFESFRTDLLDVEEPDVLKRPRTLETTDLIEAPLKRMRTEVLHELEPESKPESKPEGLPDLSALDTPTSLDADSVDDKKTLINEPLASGILATELAVNGVAQSPINFDAEEHTEHASSRELSAELSDVDTKEDLVTISNPEEFSEQVEAEEAPEDDDGPEVELELNEQHESKKEDKDSIVSDKDHGDDLEEAESTKHNAKEEHEDDEDDENDDREDNDENEENEEDEAEVEESEHADAAEVKAESGDEPVADTRDDEDDDEHDEEEEELDLDLDEQRKNAISELISIEEDFSLLRDKLYNDKLALLEHEMELCLEGSHPELLQIYYKVNEFYQQNIKISNSTLNYSLKCINTETMATRTGIHQNFMKNLTDMKNDMVAETTSLWYKINRERNYLDQIVPDYNFAALPLLNPDTLNMAIVAGGSSMEYYQDSAPLTKKAINQNTIIELVQRRNDYNEQLGVLNGLKEFHGIPCAVASSLLDEDVGSVDELLLRKATQDEINEDLQAMGIF